MSNDQDERFLTDHSRNQVSLELVEIDVEGAIESEGGGHGRHDLSDESVQIGEAGGDNTELLLANVIDSFVINLLQISVLSLPGI